MCDRGNLKLRRKGKKCGARRLAVAHAGYYIGLNFSSPTIKMQKSRGTMNKEESKADDISSVMSNGSGQHAYGSSHYFPHTATFRLITRPLEMYTIYCMYVYKIDPVSQSSNQKLILQISPS